MAARMHGRSGLSFDIFCRVIDNFGDIGVCWRLASQLASRPHNGTVRLWVDDLNSFSRLLPQIDPFAAQQQHAGVDIIHWCPTARALQPHDVVIEAFGCDPPAAFISDMIKRDSLWLNLEYLSAEPWVTDFHLRPSLQGSGIRKYFYFPGFTPKTGGLLREHDLIKRRDAWQSAPERRSALLQSLEVPSCDIEALNRGSQLAFLFCYRNAPVQALIEALSQAAPDTVVLIPRGVYPDAARSLNGKVRVHTIPFVSQCDFDSILWSADMNIVRGEDSLVRAMWAARPMIWQPYPQDDGAHLAKLDAWLQMSPLNQETCALIRSWSTGDTHTLSSQLVHHFDPAVCADWKARCQQWTRELLIQKDLATSLVEFCTQQGRTG